MAVAEVKEKLHLTLPDKYSISALDAFKASLNTHKDTFGIAALQKRVERYKYHLGLCDQFWSKAEGSVEYLSGVRGPKVKIEKSNGKIAKDFYDSLNTPSLRLQCNLFGIDFDSYEDVESIVGALVDKHVSMLEGGSSTE